MNDSVIPIDAIFGKDHREPNPVWDPRPTLVAAELIFGLDRMTGNQFLVFGRPLLASIIETGRARPCITVIIELDQETDDLEKLLALMNVVKGRHDYLPGVNA